MNQPSIQPFDTATFERVGREILDVILQYVRESRTQSKPVAVKPPLDDLINDLQLEERLSIAGANGNPDLISPLVRDFLEATTRLHDPRFIGHQVARPHFAAALADLVAGSTNNGMAVYEMGPPGCAVESFVLKWLLDHTPWDDGGGMLTHGGSLANLTAMLAARGVKDPQSWNRGIDPDLAFLVPETSHYCVQRAICMLGYGAQSLQFLPTDELGRIKVDSLEDVFTATISSGKKPVAVIANAGSTPTGAYDDLTTIGKFARKHDLWFHIDGAHGASALVSQRHRQLLDGLEFADSLVWDQHKMLQTSALCTSLLFREKQCLSKIFEQKASYLEAHEDDQFPDFFHYTIECTKAPLGLKLLLVLLSIGRKGLSDYIDATFARTKSIYKQLNATEGFSCLGPPQSNILCFQFQPQQFDQFELRERVIQQQDFYITRTVVHEQKYLRLTVMNPDSSDELLNELVGQIRKVSHS